MGKTWRQHNARRLALISQQFVSGLSEDEQHELDRLQVAVSKHIDKLYPLPNTDGLLGLIDTNHTGDGNV